MPQVEDTVFFVLMLLIHFTLNYKEVMPMKKVLNFITSAFNLVASFVTIFVFYNGHRSKFNLCLWQTVYF
nr:MAG TPA_asm: hypothetical protein [Caudoviricetes sp.]